MTITIQQLMKAVERLVDAFRDAVFVNGDVAAAVSMTAPECQLLNIPAGTGAIGHDELRRYLAEDVVPAVPAELRFTRVSRTGDRWRVADEMTVSFVHDRELPWLLPGVQATGRRVQLLAVSVVTVHRSLITSHRTLWDQATLLAQIGGAAEGVGFEPTMTVNQS